LKSLEAAFGPNSALVEELYEQYQKSPNSVPTHWKRYFDELNGVESHGSKADQDTSQERKVNQVTPSAPQKPTPSKVASKPAPAGKLQK